MREPNLYCLLVPRRGGSRLLFLLAQVTRANFMFRNISTPNFSMSIENRGTVSSCENWTATRTRMPSRGPARPSPRSPSRPISGRSKTPRRAGCFSCAATPYSAAPRDQGKAVGSTCLWGTLLPALMWLSGLSISRTEWNSAPWRDCLDRLATTPGQAAVLLRDAAAVLKARGECLAARGRRSWEPSPEMPALVIVIDDTPSYFALKKPPCGGS
jgi:hypothetical protein